MIQKKVTFQDSSWNNLVGILSIPYEWTDFPLIILTHWFCSNKDRPTYTVLEQLFIAHNIAIFRFDTFAHGESEGDLYDISLTKAVDWCYRAIQLMVQQWYKNLWLIWSSFGGCVALNIAYKYPEHLLAVWGRCPVSDYASQKQRKLWVDWIINWEKNWETIYENSNGAKFKIWYWFFEDMNNNNIHTFADKTLVPICLVHWGDDQVVLVEQSIKTDALLVDSELHIIKWADHSLNWLWEVERVNKIFLDFFLDKLWTPL